MKVFLSHFFTTRKLNQIPLLLQTPANLTERKKWSHFDLKIWVTGGTIIWPGIPSNSRIFESNCLDIASQFNSNILQLLRILDRILVQPVTQIFKSKWLHIFVQICPHTGLVVQCSLVCLPALRRSAHKDDDRD